LDGHAPESIRYMALWAVFNALYNIADYPKVKIKNVSIDDGQLIPIIRGRDENTKLCFISRKLSQDRQFVAEIMSYHREFITHLAQRPPDVHQPPNVRSIQFQHEDQSYVFDLSELYGIASLDNRIFLQNGTVLFQYRHLDLELDEDNSPHDRAKFFRQLIFMLYQLRNNIVHGGSAAFFMMKTELTISAIGLLESIVQHLFGHTEILQPE
jgi:hypothetical protein